MTKTPCCDLLPLAYDLPCVGRVLTMSEAFVLQGPFVLRGDHLFLVASSFFPPLLYLILIVGLNPSLHLYNTSFQECIGTSKVFRCCFLRFHCLSYFYCLLCLCFHCLRYLSGEAAFLYTFDELSPSSHQVGQFPQVRNLVKPRGNLQNGRLCCSLNFMLQIN